MRRHIVVTLTGGPPELIGPTGPRGGYRIEGGEQFDAKAHTGAVIRYRAEQAAAGRCRHARGLRQNRQQGRSARRGQRRRPERRRGRPAAARCAVRAGGGPHRIPMMERVNRAPAFDVVRIQVNVTRAAAPRESADPGSPGGRSPLGDPVARFEHRRPARLDRWTWDAGRRAGGRHLGGPARQEERTPVGAWVGRHLGRVHRTPVPCRPGPVRAPFTDVSTGAPEHRVCRARPARCSVECADRPSS